MISPQLPPEIVEKIILLVWKNGVLSSDERVAFMTACPRLNRTWNAQFARIASKEIYLPKLSYLLYLANIVRTGKSLIYDPEDLVTRVETMTCFLDLRSYPLSWDKSTESLYFMLTNMGSFTSFRSCFPSVKELSLEAVFRTPPHLWTTDFPQIMHTQVVIPFDTYNPTTPSDALIHHEIHINAAIHDPDAYLGITNALWNYRSNPLSDYLALVVRVISGDLGKSLQFCGPLGSSGDRPHTCNVLRMRNRLHKSRVLSDNVHLFHCNAIFVETTTPADLFGVSQHLWRSGRKISLSWDSLRNDLCDLMAKLWTRTMGTGMVKEGDWDWIMPVKEPQMEKGLLWNKAEAPFSALDSLHDLIKDNAPVMKA
ncbi:hypothetical protein D9758_009503 [Tetrapyrgos nigripes]|uniref:Uncharacterized protein n=1 Tax=Tetrapyrgos nigripes TaxID=182062 RepID=A0A8H5LEN0_9AGAR|nr:hypothetical protein D9758_009503 [Tetrapyrgos nigripes]